MEMIVNRLSAAVPQLKLCHWWPNGKLPIALNYNAVKYLVSLLRLAAYIHSLKISGLELTANARCIFSSPS